jgi:2-haloacid dehalogenase/putative hydrolase of the HAD superfamily
MTQPRAILLDFYGTVVEEDRAPIVLVCNEIIKTSSRAITLEEVRIYWVHTFQEMCFKSCGNTFRYEKELGQEALRETVKRFDTDLNSEKLTQALSDYWDEYWGKPVIFPESRDVLAKVEELGIPVCLVSNIDNDVLDSALLHNQLSFDLVITSEDCKSYKPRPEMFDKALSLLNLSNKEVLHVGDSAYSDVKGAKSLGIPVLWINRRKRTVPAEYEPDHISADLTGILDLIG